VQQKGVKMVMHNFKILLQHTPEGMGTAKKFCQHASWLRFKVDTFTTWSRGAHGYGAVSFNSKM